MKSSYEGVLLLVKLQPKVCNFTKSNTHSWLFSTLLKFYKWDRIAQSASHYLTYFSQKRAISPFFQKHLVFLLGSFGFATWWKEVFHWCLCYLYYVCCTSRQNADCMKLSENDNILTRFFPNKWTVCQVFWKYCLRFLF